MTTSPSSVAGCGDNFAALIEQIGQNALLASRRLATASESDKNTWLNAMADALDQRQDEILQANQQDMDAARENGISGAMLDRLCLTPDRLKGIADALRHVATLPDPVGTLLSRVIRPNGLRIDKVSVPIGVIGFIYEARPNVTADAAGLCLKSGNAVILRGGSEAFHSSRTLARILATAGERAGMPCHSVQLIPTTDRAAVHALLKLDRYVNLIVPRGGERLIRTVVQESTIPVIKHYKGVCHIFVDASCDFTRALDIIENAKCQRPGVCNALETLLIHSDALASFAPRIAERLREKGVRMRADDAFRAFVPDAEPASEQDWFEEYLDLVLAIRTVPSLQDAVDHIHRYGSGHSDSILTDIPENAGFFLDNVDSAAVYVNASTRFTDGGEFGMGAEIGISTDKLHARGPMGLAELTSYKYKIYGDGQIR